jgi:hypothetical protein
MCRSVHHRTNPPPPPPPLHSGPYLPLPHQPPHPALLLLLPLLPAQSRVLRRSRRRRTLTCGP